MRGICILEQIIVLSLFQRTQDLTLQQHGFQPPRPPLGKGVRVGINIYCTTAVEIEHARSRKRSASCPKTQPATPSRVLFHWPLAIKISQKFPKRAVSMARNFFPNHLSLPNPPPAPGSALSSNPNDIPLRQMPKATAGVLEVGFRPDVAPASASVSSRGTGTSRAGSSTLTCAFFTVTSRFCMTLWILCTVCKLILAARLLSSAAPPPNSSASLLRIALR